MDASFDQKRCSGTTFLDSRSAATSAVIFWGRREDDILREIAKCELVCTNCHAIRTFRRSGWGDWSVQESEAPYGEKWFQIGA